MSLTVTFNQSELPQLRVTLDRAMNTWEPQNQPPWLQELSDLVDERIGLPPSQPYSARTAP